MIVKVVKKGISSRLYEADELFVPQEPADGLIHIEMSRKGIEHHVALAPGEAVIYVMGETGKTLDTFRL